jgi:hypothetical protein
MSTISGHILKQLHDTGANTKYSRSEHYDYILRK